MRKEEDEWKMNGKVNQNSREKKQKQKTKMKKGRAFLQTERNLKKFPIYPIRKLLTDLTLMSKKVGINNANFH